MKKINLKKSILALAMTVATISFATANNRTQSFQTMDACVNSYVNLIKYGDVSSFNALFTEDAKFSISANGKVINHTKAEELNFFKKNKGVTQQCEVQTAVMVNTDSYTIVKVSQIYDSFTRENFVTFVKSGKDWKINAVSSEFK